MQSNILSESVKEGLWGISSQGPETCNSVNSSLSALRATEVAQRSSSKLGAQRRLCEELQSELMSIDTHSHSVLPRPSAAAANNTQANKCCFETNAEAQAANPNSFLDQFCHFTVKYLPQCRREQLCVLLSAIPSAPQVIAVPNP